MPKGRGFTARLVISKAEGLALLRKRGYIFKDELSVDSG